MLQPMTLTEFERAAVEAIESWRFPLLSHTVPTEEGVARMRPLILRLLAGERERCKEALLTHSRKPDCFGRVFYQEEEKAIEYGYIIWKMKDPTP